MVFGFFSVDIQTLFLVRKLVVMVLLEDIIIFLNIHCLRERQTQGCRDKSAPSLVLNINVHFTSLVQVKYGRIVGLSIEQFKI